MKERATKLGFRLVGGTPEQILAAALAARTAGVISGVGYNYRWAPLVRYARELIASGELGQITNYRGRFFSTYGADPLGVNSWRFQLEQAGYGVTSDLLSHAVDLAHMLLGRRAGHRLDAAHAGRDRALAHDPEQADVAGAQRMRAAAELDRILLAVAAAHRQHAHFLAVFLAEQSASAGRARFVEPHQPRRHLGVFQDNVVGDVLDLFKFGPSDRLRMGDVEAQPLGRNQRALLRDMIAKHDAQSLMQDVSRRMVRPRRRARAVVDLKLDRLR